MQRSLSFVRLPLACAVMCLCGFCASIAAAQTAGAGAAPTGVQRPSLQSSPGALDRAYLLQPGDAVTVTFRYTPEFNEDVVVGPDGHAIFRAAGELKVSGLTVAQLQQVVVHNSAEKLVNPEVVVTLKDFDRPHVFVAGEVGNPGRQELKRPTTVLQAILMSGGPKEDAALSRVLLFRRIDAEVAEVHVLKLSRHDHKTLAANDMLLQPDDMVLVSHDRPSRMERFVKVANLGFYLNPLQNVAAF